MLYKVIAPLEIISGMRLLEIKRKDYTVGIFLTGLADIIVFIISPPAKIRRILK